jgi:hypothetical protein
MKRGYQVFYHFIFELITKQQKMKQNWLKKKFNPSLFIQEYNIKESEMLSTIHLDKYATYMS